jgi:hypothetical protein
MALSEAGEKNGYSSLAADFRGFNGCTRRSPAATKRLHHRGKENTEINSSWFLRVLCASVVKIFLPKGQEIPGVTEL